MSDRELLEMAAKAAGIEVPKALNGRPSPWYWIDDNGIHKDTSSGGDGTRYWRWNPLTDDGDALRLAVKLGLVLNLSAREDCRGQTVVTYQGAGKIEQPCYEGREAAARRAIVRAAAEIGRQMP